MWFDIGKRDVFVDHVAHILTMFSYIFIINTSLVKRCAGNINILWKCQKYEIVEVMKELLDHKFHVSLVFSSSSITF